MSARYRITPRAFKDLKAIAHYSLASWGALQRDAYLGDLERRFAWLAENPQAGKERTDVRDGYRSYLQGVHIIFYIVRDEAIDIIGVPHQSMDTEGYFGKDWRARPTRECRSPCSTLRAYSGRTWPLIECNRFRIVTGIDDHGLVARPGSR